jgi:hypothetical protein
MSVTSSALWQERHTCTDSFRTFNVSHCLDPLVLLQDSVMKKGANINTSDVKCPRRPASLAAASAASFSGRTTRMWPGIPVEMEHFF